MNPPETSEEITNKKILGNPEADVNAGNAPRQKGRPPSSTELATFKVRELERVLERALTEARHVHILVMRASEEIGQEQNTGAAHACLGLMEVSLHALSQANNAARYARHAIEYPRKG